MDKKRYSLLIPIKIYRELAWIKGITGKTINSILIDAIIDYIKDFKKEYKVLFENNKSSKK